VRRNFIETNVRQPEPTNIGKTESHGCIRLRDWDAVDLAAMVRPGTAVKFEDEDSPLAPLPGPDVFRRAKLTP